MRVVLGVEDMADLRKGLSFNTVTTGGTEIEIFPAADPLDIMDPLELRAEAERIIGEDRVPADVLRDLIRNHGGD